MEKEKLWNGNYNRVMITNFSLFFSFYLLTPLLPIYLSETFDASKDMIGLVLSGYTLVALITRPFSGFIADSFPRKKVLLVCLFLYFIIFGGYIVAGSLVLFAIFRTLHGGPFGASTVSNSTMAIDVLPPSRRNEGIGLYGLSNNLASAIAPTIGIYLHHYFHNFDILFWTAFIVAGIGFFNASRIVPQEKQIIASKTAISLDRFFLSRGWFLALNMCFFGFCWGVLSNYLAIYGKEHLGITEGTGTFFMLLSAGLIFSRLQGNKSLRDGKLTSNALKGILLSTVGYTLFIAYPSMIGYYTSGILIGLGNGHMWPAFQNMIINIAHHNERGTANSTILTSWDLGLGLGILLGGIVAEHFGYDSTFWMMATVHIVGTIGYIGFTMRKFTLLSASFSSTSENSSATQK
ncbi:MAG: MFS transporter [Bacteroidaceae bacterium]|nr:MFS transporter [Bacteroidaceae bacterium]